jgi:predicted Zn finger-like uncharacterized protein
MILACPACATRFQVPDDALGDRPRRVRCSVCRLEWRVPGGTPPRGEPGGTPAAVTTAVAPPGPAAPAAAERAPAALRLATINAPAPVRTAPPEPRPRAPARSRRGPVAALLLLVLALAAAGGWLARDRVVAALPWLQPIVERLTPATRAAGLPETLVLDRVESARVVESGRDVVLVQGVVRNAGDGARLLPAVLVTLKDADGRPLKAQAHRLAEAELASGGAAAFSVRVLDPPPAAERYDVTFLTAPGAGPR